MSGSRLALVSDDPRFASALGSHFQKNLGPVALVRKFDTILEHLGPDTDGVLVLVVTSPADAKRALRLVQEIALQKWPPAIFIVLTESAAPCKELACLEPFIARLLQWPDDSALLTGLDEERLGRGQS